MGVCVHCHGDGIDPEFSVRGQSMVRAVFHLASADGKTPWRANVKAVHERTATTLTGPLKPVIAEANLRLKLGFVVVAGDIPEREAACEHCDGSGRCDFRCCRLNRAYEVFPRGAPSR